MDFLIATHNMKKQAELQRILKPLGINVLTADMAGIGLTDVEETGTTFEENAYLKAKSGCDESGMICVADDSGLSVDCLDGAPGVYSARFAGEHGNDSKNMDKLLDLMKDIPWEDRDAKFVSAVCCCFPDGRHFTVRGECKGKIAYERHGNGGFGYDPVFMVGEKTFGELSSEEKDKISHRGNALKKFVNELPGFLENGE
ncbi:MAG: RdgB/HAM1 family non-canonical purine NTP pyrophosphatase [Clostridiales bacterium]|nr:RdgB/HAM1 family non-canonical purine NTP pyrophosphatase [Clostridiales bacterium]